MILLIFGATEKFACCFVLTFFAGKYFYLFSFGLCLLILLHKCLILFYFVFRCFACDLDKSLPQEFYEYPMIKSQKIKATSFLSFKRIEVSGGSTTLLWPHMITKRTHSYKVKRNHFVSKRDTHIRNQLLTQCLEHLHVCVNLQNDPKTQWEKKVGKGYESVFTEQRVKQIQNAYLLPSIDRQILR